MMSPRVFIIVVGVLALGLAPGGGARCVEALCDVSSNPCGVDNCYCGVVGVNSNYCSYSGSVATCTCLPGWTGADCQTKNGEKDPCNPSPCGQHGSCQNIGGQAKCTCTGNYTGTHCETAPATPSVPAGCVRENIDFQTEPNLGSQGRHADTKEDCAKLCNATSGCKAWTWDQNQTKAGQNGCWLKTQECKKGDSCNISKVGDYSGNRSECGGGAAPPSGETCKAAELWQACNEGTKCSAGNGNSPRVCYGYPWFAAGKTAADGKPAKGQCRPESDERCCPAGDPYCCKGGKFDQSKNQSGAMCDQVIQPTCTDARQRQLFGNLRGTAEMDL